MCRKNSTFKSLIILIPIILLFIITGCDTVNLNYNITVRGQITDYSDGRPLEDVKIKVNDKITYTNSSGYYSVNNVDVNNYLEWSAEKEGYWTVTDKYYIITDSEKIINKRLKKAGEYSGRISGEVAIFSASQQKTTSNIKNQTTSLKISTKKAELKSYSGLEKNYLPGEILVKFKSDSDVQKLQHIANKIGGTTRSRKNIYKIEVPEGMTTEELLNQYKNRDDVEIAGYNHIGYLMSSYIPDDTFYYQQWGLQKIYTPDSWRDFGTTGSSSINVAVIDTGYVPHPDLNILDNYGYDFVDNDYEPHDEDATGRTVSHGTHVAGIIGAVGNNDLGVTGVNWNVNIMPIRIFRIKDYGAQYFEEADLISAIEYAVDNGADIINLSLAFVDTNVNLNDRPYSLVEDVLRYAYNSGVTVVAAAGNDNVNYVYYPARSDYTIAVGATGPDNNLTSYTNYGHRLDIVAPGGKKSGRIEDGILSTHKYFGDNSDHDYMYMAGTSMAVPHVAGAAALLMSRGIGISNPAEIKNILTGTALPLYDDRLDSIGLLNIHAAFNEALLSNANYEAKVMAAIKKYEDGRPNYYVVSDVATVNSQGEYNIYQAKTGDMLTVFGWIDSHENGYLDAGDYFGEYELRSPLYENEHREDINFSMEYISDMALLSSSYGKIIYGPPPEE